MYKAVPVTLLVLVSLSASASAHVILTSHESRDGRANIKDGPCGLEGSTRGASVHTFEAGETITLVWNEFIPHPGWYRISFDSDGQDDFGDPADYEDLYTNDAVLVDSLFPHERSGVDGPWTYELELPATPCANCTLQLVQMMTDKPPYVAGTNDLYYNCLDVVLTGTAGDVGSPDVGQEDVGPPDTGASDGGIPDGGDTDGADLGAPDSENPEDSADSPPDPTGSDTPNTEDPSDAGGQGADDLPTVGGLRPSGSGCATSATGRGAGGLGALLSILVFGRRRSKR